MRGEVNGELSRVVGMPVTLVQPRRLDGLQGLGRISGSIGRANPLAECCALDARRRGHPTCPGCKQVQQIRNGHGVLPSDLEFPGARTCCEGANLSLPPPSGHRKATECFCRSPGSSPGSSQSLITSRRMPILPEASWTRIPMSSAVTLTAGSPRARLSGADASSRWRQIRRCSHRPSGRSRGRPSEKGTRGSRARVTARAAAPTGTSQPGVRSQDRTFSLRSPCRHLRRVMDASLACFLFPQKVVPDALDQIPHVRA